MNNVTGLSSPSEIFINWVTFVLLLFAFFLFILFVLFEIVLDQDLLGNNLYRTLSHFLLKFVLDFINLRILEISINKTKAFAYGF